MEVAQASHAGDAFSTSRAFAAFLNHLLRGNPWALERLSPFAGKIALIKAVPFRLALCVQDNGEVAPAVADAVPDATITGTLPLLLRILSMREPDLSLAELSGDAALLELLGFLVRYLSWDVEEDLSQVFGDMVAHRLATDGKKVLAWPGNVLLSFAGALAEYWSEERPTLARSEDVRRFLREVELLRQETDTLAARLDRLERK